MIVAFLLAFLMFGAIGLAANCDINITAGSCIMDQNNTYYYLANNITASTLYTVWITSSNSTLDCQGYTINNGGEAIMGGGIGNTVKNCIITNSDAGVEAGSGYTVLNNTCNSVTECIMTTGGSSIINNIAVSSSNRGLSISGSGSFVSGFTASGCGIGIEIVSGSSNNITESLFNSSSLYDYRFYHSLGNSYFIANDFSSLKKIQFDPILENIAFNYRHIAGLDVMLATNYSQYIDDNHHTAVLSRIISNWNETYIKWNDTGSNVFGYTFSGLYGNVTYSIINNSVFYKNLTTDISGNLPYFDISLASEHELIVTTSETPAEIPYVSLVFNFSSVNWGSLDQNTTSNSAANNYQIDVDTNCNATINFSALNPILTNGSYNISNSNVKFNYTINTNDFNDLLAFDADRLVNVTGIDVVYPRYYLDIPDNQYAGLYSGSQMITASCS